MLIEPIVTTYFKFGVLFLLVISHLHIHHVNCGSSQYQDLYSARNGRARSAPLSADGDVGDIKRYFSYADERILNSILKQLEIAKEEQMESAAAQINQEPFTPEYTASLPENWGRDMRQIGLQKHFPICHLERKIVTLNDNEFEYRPSYYEEMRCIHKEHEQNSRNEICSSLGFSCVQWNKTIHLTRRTYTSDCWETMTMIIPAGCECMWPVHKLGDIKLHL